MDFLRAILCLLNAATLLKLRRRMISIDPESMRAMDQLDPLSALSRWVFPGWVIDLTRLQTAVLFRPDVFSLTVLADDVVFKLMRRLQRSITGAILLSLFAAALG